MNIENNPANVGEVEVAAKTLVQFLKGYGTSGRVTPDAVTRCGGTLRDLLAGLRATLNEFLADKG